MAGKEIAKEIYRLCYRKMQLKQETPENMLSPR